MKLMVSLSRGKVLDLDPKRPPYLNVPDAIFHGTSVDFDHFDMNKAGANDWGYLGRGMYFSSDANHAAIYARKSAQKNFGNKRDGARVIRAVWRKKPRLYPVSKQEYDTLFAASRRRDFWSKEVSDHMTAELRDKDFDGAIYVHPDKAGTKEIVLYDLSLIDT